MVSGVAVRLPLPARLKPALHEAHQWGALWAVYVGLFHGLVLLGNGHIKFTWLDVAVPFAGRYQPVLVGAGSLALYGLVGVVLSSHLRPFLSPAAWRRVHVLSYPAYLLALWHGVALGPDTGLAWVRALYAGTAALLAALSLLRLAGDGPRRGRAHQAPARSSR